MAPTPISVRVRWEEPVKTTITKIYSTTHSQPVGYCITKHYK